MKFINIVLKKKVEALEALGSHDQIPAILGHFEDKDGFYLVEEHVVGHPLSEELEPHKPLPEDKVIHILQDVLAILNFIHGHRVTHQCIQPSTLIRRDADKKLVVTGSGVMREVSAQYTKASPQIQQSILLHSSIYTPIEQIQGQPKFNSDIYALGMIAVQALTGLPDEALGRVKPHNGSSDTMPAWQEYAEASPGLIRILERMVHPEAHRRYQTVKEVLSDLEGFARENLLQTTPTVIEEEQGIPEFGSDRSDSFDSNNRDSAALVKTLSMPSHYRRYAWMGGLVLMLLCGTVLALVTGRLPLASGDNQATSSPEKVDRSSRESSTVADSEASYQEGMAHIQQSKSQEAIASFTQAIQLDQANAKAYYERGNVRMQLGDAQNAVRDYTDALRVDPELAPAYVNRGNARADLGDDQTAVEDYTQAIALYTRDAEADPQNRLLTKRIAAAYLNRCLSYSNIGNQQSAINDCTEAIRLEPDNVLAYQNRGLARRRLKQPQTAIRDFNIAIKFDPEDADPYYNRGLARIELGDVPGAIADYTKAIQFHPGHTLAYYDRGLARADLGDTQGAIADLQESATLCLDAGRTTCYEDAQYHINQLKSQ